MTTATAPTRADVCTPHPLEDEETYRVYLESHIGIPYHFAGEDPTTGMDCRTLPVRFLRGLGYDVVDTDGDPIDEHSAADVERYERAVRNAGQAVELDVLQRHDLVYFRNRHGRLHVGVWLGYNRMLTTDQASGSHIVRVYPDQLRGAVRCGRQAALEEHPTPVPPGREPISLGTVIYNIIQTIVVTGVMYGIGALVGGGKPKLGAFPSPRYELDGFQNVRSNQVPVPLIYSGDGIRVSTAEIWNSGAGTEQDRLVVIGEGELGSITEVELNGDAIATFTDVTHTVYTGTAAQGVDSRASVSDVKGLKNTAYLALTLAADEKLNGDPVITCKVTGKKIEIWNGSDWTTLAAAASGNAAACIRNYLLTPRSHGGVGLSTAEVDDASFGAVYDHLEVVVDNGAGGTEPRGRLDYVVDTFRPWQDNVQDMLVTFGGFLRRRGRTYYLEVEKSEAVSQAFVEAQVEDGTLEYTTFSKAERPNRIVGVYIDPTAEGNDARTRVSVDDLVDQDTNPRGMVSQELGLLGISRQSQAIREITKVLNDLRVNWYGVSFQIDISALKAEAGDVISVTHSILGDGTTAYPFRIIEIEEAEDHKRTIRAKAYNSSVFGDTLEQGVVTLEHVPIPNPFRPPSDVSSITINEGGYTDEDGTYHIKLTGTFTAGADDLNLSHYLLLLDEDSNGYRVIDELLPGDTSYEIRHGITAGSTYTVKIKAVSRQGGIISTGATSSPLAVTGNGSAPANATGIAYTFTDALVLTWNKNTEADLAGYEIRTADSGWGADNNFVFRGLATRHEIQQPASRAPGTYYLRAYNRSGNFSAASVSVVPTNAAPATPTLTVIPWFGWATASWTDSADQDLLYYEIWKSTTNAWGGEETLVDRFAGGGGATARKAQIVGQEPRQGVAEDDGIANTNYVTDDALAGLGANYLVGWRVEITEGTGVSETGIISAYDNATGKCTITTTWTAPPDTSSKFTVTDHAWYKVRGVDTYGAGTLSAAVEVTFTNITEAMLSDLLITARKITTGELITLGAQIRDAIIQNGHVLNLDVSKLTAGTIGAVAITIATGGSIESANFDDTPGSEAGWKLSGTQWINYDGIVKGELVTLQGQFLSQLFTINASSHVIDLKSEFEATGYSVSNVTIGGTEGAPDLALTSGQTSGYYRSPALQIDSKPLGVASWQQSGYGDPKATDVAQTGTASTNVNSGEIDEVNDGNDNTSWKTTGNQGLIGYVKLDLGSAKNIRRATIKASDGKAFTLHYSTDDITYYVWQTFTNADYDTFTKNIDGAPQNARYWKLTCEDVSGSQDWWCYTFALFEEAVVSATIKYRTDDNSSMSSPTAWSTAYSTAEGVQLGQGGEPATDTYIQYQLDFSSDYNQVSKHVYAVSIGAQTTRASDAEALQGFSPAQTPAANSVVVSNANSEISEGWLPASIKPIERIIIFDEFLGDTLDQRWHEGTGVATTLYGTIYLNGILQLNSGAIWMGDNGSTSKPAFRFDQNPSMKMKIAVDATGYTGVLGFKISSVQSDGEWDDLTGHYGAFWEIDLNTPFNFKARTTTPTTHNVTSSGIAPTSQQFYILEVRVVDGGTKVEFYIDDVLEATHTTDLPLTTTELNAGINWEGGGSDPMWIDWVQIIAERN